MTTVTYATNDGDSDDDPRNADNAEDAVDEHNKNEEEKKKQDPKYQPKTVPDSAIKAMKKGIQGFWNSTNGGDCGFTYTKFKPTYKNGKWCFEAEYSVIVVPETEDPQNPPAPDPGVKAHEEGHAADDVAAAKKVCCEGDSGGAGLKKAAEELDKLRKEAEKERDKDGHGRP